MSFNYIDFLIFLSNLTLSTTKAKQQGQTSAVATRGGGGGAFRFIRNSFSEQHVTSKN